MAIGSTTTGSRLTMKNVPVVVFVEKEEKEEEILALLECPAD